MSNDTLARRDFLGMTAATLAGAQLAMGAKAETPAATNPAGSQPAFRYEDQQHTDLMFRTVPRRLSFQAKNAEELKQWQTALRARMMELLGLNNLAREVKFENRAERAESVRLDGYTREKWYLYTEPDVPLPIWVLIPDKPVAKPYPLVLTPHGHNPPEHYVGIAADAKAREEIQQKNRDIALQAVREGYLCIHPTARGFGETMRADDRKAKKVSSCRTGQMHAILFGRTMVGNRVWDIGRILDWALDRYEIDKRRICVTGNSGGGTTSLFTSACEERITVSVPSCYFCTFQASIGSIYHCECNYIPNLLREAEMYDVAGLIAPRPFRAIAGNQDAIFPIAAVRESYAKLREIYRVAGVEDRCELYEGDGPHRYYSNGAWPFIRQWFDRLANA